MRVSINYKEPVYNSEVKIIKIELPLQSVDGKKLSVDDGISNKPIKDILIETGPADVNPSKEYSLSYDVYSNLSIYFICEGTAGTTSPVYFNSPSKTGHMSILELTEDEISRIEDEFIKKYYESATEEDLNKLPPEEVIYLIRKASERAEQIIQEVKSTKKLKLSASILSGKLWFVSYILDSIGCPDNAVLIPEGNSLIPVGNNENIITLIPLKLNSKISSRKERISEFDQLCFYAIYGEHVWHNYHKYLHIGSDQYPDDIIDDWKSYGFLDKCQIIRPDGDLSMTLGTYPNYFSIGDITYQISHLTARLSNESIYYFKDPKFLPTKVVEIDIYPRLLNDPLKVLSCRGSLEEDLIYWEQNSDSIGWIISSLDKWECNTPPFELIEEHLSKYGIKNIEYPLWIQPLRNYINKYGYNDVSDYESAKHAIITYLNALYCNRCFNTGHKDSIAKNFFLEAVFNFECETVTGDWINPNWTLYENVDCVKLIRLFWKTYYDKIDPMIRGFYFGNTSSVVIKIGDTINTATDALKLITDWRCRVEVEVVNKENITLDTKPLLNVLNSALEIGISPFQIISNYYKQFDNYHYDYLCKDLWDYKSVNDIVNEIIDRFVEFVYNSSNCKTIINII